MSDDEYGLKALNTLYCDEDLGGMPFFSPYPPNSPPAPPGSPSNPIEISSDSDEEPAVEALHKFREEVDIDLCDSEGDQEPEETGEPDLALYFSQFDLDFHEQVSICRSYASYLVAVGRGLKTAARRGPRSDASYIRKRPRNSARSAE